MFTKKDFIAIADIIAALRGPAMSNTRVYVDSRLLVEQLGKLFKQDNPRFDFKRFEKACETPASNELLDSLGLDG